MTKNENYKFLYSLYDNVTELFEPPFVDVNNGSAIRRIQDLMQSNPQSSYSKFPDSYSLHCIGTWNEETANVYTDGTDIIQPLTKLIIKKE